MGETRDAGWSQGYHSLLISHQEPQRESSLWTSFWLLPGSPLFQHGWLFLLASVDGMQGQGVLGQASDKGQRTPFFGVGHLGLTLAHRVLTLGFLFPSTFFLELSFVIPMVA